MQFLRYLTLNRLRSSLGLQSTTSTSSLNTSTSRLCAHKSNANNDLGKCVDVDKLRRLSVPIAHGVRTGRSSIIGQRRVNKTFVTMLVVYLATYLPLSLMTGYMNLCVKCNCILIRVLSDCTSISILLSALLRPVTFIFRLRTIRKEVTNILNSIARHRSKERRGESLSTEYSSNTGVAFIVRQSHATQTI